MKSHVRKLLYGAFLIALIAGLGGAWTVYASATPPQELTLYENDLWHFAINIPADVTADDVENQGDAQLIQFSDPNADHVFEIIAAPYTQMDVALGREGDPNDALSDQPLTLALNNVYHDDMLRYAFHRNGIEYTLQHVLKMRVGSSPSSGHGNFTQ
jgi:hypothetical protein